MAIYWTIGQFPELGHLSEGERAAVLRRVSWRAYLAMVGRAMIGGMFVGLFTVMVASAVAGRIVHGWEWAVWVGAGLVGAVGAYLVQMRSVRIFVRREVARGFRGERLPFCLGCGYDLRAGVGERCPECGKATAGERWT